MAQPGKVREFAPVPKRAVKLAAGPLRVLVALGCYVNRDGQCWPSVPTLARDLGMTDRGLQKHLALLIDEGFLEVTRNTGAANTYTIKYGEPVQPMGGESQVHHPSAWGDSQVHPTPEAQVHPTPDPEVHPNYLKELNQRTTKDRRRSNGAVPYAFEGVVIRITIEQLQTWQKSFSAIPDVLAELRSLDDYYAAKGGDGWFHRTSTNLAKRHQKLLNDGVTPKRRRRQIG